MNDRAVRLERLVDLARGLARDDFVLSQICKRMYEYVRDALGPVEFRVVIADEDGNAYPEYHVANGVEQPLDAGGEGPNLAKFSLQHGDRDLGAVFVGADAAALQQALPDFETALDFFTLAVGSVQKLRATERRIDRDNLTNLYNRNYGMRRLREELQRAARLQSRVCVLQVDIDGLQELNSRYGHPTGDSAIRTVGDALRSICRHSDVLCRFSGDRFLIVYPDFSGDPGPVARRVRTQVEMRVLPVPGGAIGLKASVGAAVGQAGSDGEALVRESERALARDKQERRRS